jgi:putative Holliday junction resolvase
MGIVRDYEVERVIVGLPRNMNGSEGPQAEKTREFARLLAERGIEVDLWDERLTTVEATRILQDRGVKRRDIARKVDELAATIILDSYLRHAGSRQPTPTRENPHVDEI